ncbi:MAG: T9SS type A sorting domain-containing protein [Ferruginibacter sp.]
MTKQKITFLAGIFLCLLCSSLAKAQIQTARYLSMTTNSNAFYEYLPQGYPAAGTKYPLMIFLHGSGENGPGTAASLPTVLRNGPPKLINSGTFPTSFTVNSKTYSFIVLSPQCVVWPTEADVDNMIDYAIIHYAVDINRIYLTGLSQGGGTVWNHSGSSSLRAGRLAAILPVCGAGYPYPGHALTLAAANLPVWATHNSGDGTVPSSYSIDYVNLINAAPFPPTPLARKTIFPVSGHDAWTQTYDPNYKENGLNVYEWMLQYKRNFSVLAVSSLELSASLDAGKKINLQWTTTGETNNLGFNILRSADGRNFTSIGFVNSTAVNGAGANYTFTDNLPLSGKNYYKLELKDRTGSLTYSQIKIVQAKDDLTISFFPNPAKDILNIQTQQNFNGAVLRISNSGGQQVHQQIFSGPGTVQVNIAKLPPGIYYGVITEKDNEQKFRFIKQ